MTKNDDNFVPWGKEVNVAGCVVAQGGKYLLVQEKWEHAYKLWNLPAGKVEDDETIEVGAVRETKEESGFDVEIVRPLVVREGDEARPTLHSFEAKIVGGELQHQEEELLDARFFSLDEVRQMSANNQLRNPWVLNSIEASLT